ncbi:L10-interacting MYB domain-containing protein-like isoform X2 [Camellia sinensis]|uniref:L10-interacting MYB domain-containing protein-like isoform X2 n=1 Tax=Camellia sinensis TaxID=4442 RepID=UPI00103649E4|nr:L10-interacting MYB domain-containing protein-like isoform X2 [Camellia sinensis]
MRRSATPKQQRRPTTKTLFRCGRFELRVTKNRRQRVTPSVSCDRFDLRCTKIREERIHLGTPPFTEHALKTKQKAAHTPDSIASSFAENDMEMDSEGFVEDVQELRLWPSRIELAFIQLMVEEVKQDLSVTKKNTFTTRHWTRIDDEQYSQFKVRYTVNRLKQKYHRIRQAYNTFVKLKNHTGFGWDEQRKTVMAPNDGWDHYVKAHPRAKVFKKKGLDHIDLLDVLFANSQATGTLARASTQGPPTSDEERDIQSASFGVGINSNTDYIPIDDDIDRDDDPKVGGSSGNDGGRKGAHFDLALDTWTATNLAKKEFFARQNKMAEASQAEKKQNSIAACIQCLATMDEITPDQYVKACESFRDKATRKMFM